MVLAGIGGYAYIRNKLGKLQYEEISKDATELGISDQAQEKTSQMNKFRNIDLIRQIEDGEVVTDIQKFEGYNIETMTEGLIPDELKDKFEKVKQYINTNKD